ncbi:MAG: stage II sporulation protein R [Halanaerobiales bacterium]
MKKIKIYLFVILCTIIIMNLNVNSAFVSRDASELINAYKNNNLVRLHVLANSNSPFDQYIKRKIRNQVLNYMRKFADDKNLKVENQIGDINDYINNILELEGVDYQASVELGTYDFPERTYDDLTLPAGRYEALKITLGNGRGANWWCVLLPPMCIEDQNEENLEAGEIKIKFKIIEWIHSVLDRNTVNSTECNSVENLEAYYIEEKEELFSAVILDKYPFKLDIEENFLDFYHGNRGVEIAGSDFQKRQIFNQVNSLFIEDNARESLANID